LGAAALLASGSRLDAQVVKAVYEVEYVASGVPITIPQAITSTLTGLIPGGDRKVEVTWGIGYQNGDSTTTVNLKLEAPENIYTAGALAVLTNGIPASITPTVVQAVPINPDNLVRAAGTVSLDSFGIGATNVTQRIRIRYIFSDRIAINSPVAADLVLPARLIASAFAAESFGDMNSTFGKVTAAFSGTVNGMPVTGTGITIESVSAIPEEGSIAFSTDIPYTLAPGINVFDTAITTDFVIEAAAFPTGIFGIISCASTAGLDLPNSFEIDRFRMADGSLLPAGLTITSDNFGLSYIAPLAIGLSTVVDNTSVVTRVTMTFTGPGVEASGSLSDGRYEFKVLGTGVVNFDGDGDFIAGGDSSYHFHRLFGDADGDADVDAADFNSLRTPVGGGGCCEEIFGAFNANLAFDYDGDGDVDALDLRQFRVRFGMTV
jgi:hypothetical protein